MACRAEMFPKRGRIVEGLSSLAMQEVSLLLTDKIPSRLMH